MSTHVAIIPLAIRRRWDALAIDQLCEALTHQGEQLERLERDNGDADYWYEQYLEMHTIVASISSTGSTAPGNNTLPPDMQVTLAAALPGGERGRRPLFPCLDEGASDLDDDLAACVLVAHEGY